MSERIITKTFNLENIIGETNSILCIYAYNYTYQHKLLYNYLDNYSSTHNISSIEYRNSSDIQAIMKEQSNTDFHIMLVDYEPSVAEIFSNSIRLKKRMLLITAFPFQDISELNSRIVSPDIFSNKASFINNLFSNKKVIEITNPDGTNLLFELDINRKWLLENGVPSEPLYISQLPDGELFTCPISSSVNGKIINKRFNVELFLEDGKAVRGDDYHSDIIKHVNNVYNIPLYLSEFGIGLNPNIDKNESNFSILEKCFETIHFGFGNDYGLSKGEIPTVDYHFDIVVENPSIKVDGKVVMKNGRYK